MWQDVIVVNTSAFFLVGLCVCVCVIKKLVKIVTAHQYISFSNNIMWITEL